jgi:hypothetical protein
LSDLLIIEIFALIIDINKRRMPSVTDLQQQSSKISSNNSGKSTPPLQQQINSTSSGITTDTTNVDPITQAILMLEKKQRNLGKRKVLYN